MKKPSALVRMMCRSIVKGKVLENARRVATSDIFKMSQEEFDHLEKDIRSWAKIKVKGVRGEG